MDIKIKQLKEIEGEPRITRLRTALNQVGAQLSDQYAEEIMRYLESVISQFEVATTQRLRSVDPGVIDIVVIPTSEEALIEVIREVIDSSVKEKGLMIEFMYREAKVRLIQANSLNFHNTVNMVSGFGVLDINMQNRIQKDGYKLNRYGIWKKDKLIVANKYDIIRLLDR